MRKSVSLFFFSLSLFISAHAALPLEHLLYVGKAVPFYGTTNSGQEAMMDIAQRGRFAEQMASVVNSSLRIKNNIDIGFESCGQANAFFSPSRRAIVICTEFVEMIFRTAFDDHELMRKLPQTDIAQAMLGIIWGVYLHELAHALIHTNSVPVAGREEDVADQFTVWFSVNFIDPNRTQIIMPTIWLWKQMAKERSITDMTDSQRKRFMSNEHSLDEQRVFNLACWVLGTGLTGGEKASRFAGLPEARASRCQGEYAQTDFAMKSHFKRYFKSRPLRGSW
jgi:hypothetical protein